MLEYLRIKNLALIQDLQMEFSSGLNVLTGESGAGKSFILRALDFILGDKLSTSMIRPGQDKAQVEALFFLEGEEYILRRELFAQTGRSRVYLNDNLSSQEKIKELKNKLIIHTSQHGQQKLLSPSYHTQILDSFLEGEIFKQRDELFSELKKIDRRKKELKQKAESLSAQKEFLAYQKNEIEKVAPKPDEEEELEERKSRLKDQANYQKNLQVSLDLLHSPENDLLGKVLDLQKQVSGLAGLDPEFEQYGESLEEFRLQLQELDRHLHNQPVFQDNEAELEKIESRLWQLSQLQRRLGKDLKNILSLQEEIDNNLSFLDQCGLELQQLSRQKEELAEQLKAHCRQISQMRRQTAENLKKELEAELKSLGFSKQVQVVFEFEANELFPGIKEDRARLMWIPNPGQPAQPLDKIASGGELSRFLLALVGLMSKQDLPTLLFDEVDAGIGGVILGQVGEKISQIAKEQQVILVSHWPQLACLAERHFQVKKEIEADETYTKCALLDKDNVFDELARMAGGGKQGELMTKELMERRKNG